ncbi:MAG: hypothetical protein KAV82_03000 [Phycisphaerae bacterium]|nr:hypothetical protein [Phycisphaerae bacterium]
MMAELLRMLLSLRVLVVFVVSLSAAVAAPKPSLAPASWQLKFEFHDPARIDVVLPGEHSPTTFWYLLYTAANETGREVFFYPQFELVTDRLELIHSGDNVSPAVFDAIHKRHSKLHPFLVRPLKASGKLLQGADNARTSVAIFRSFHLDASSFVIYVAGLSGEVIRVPNPAFDPGLPQNVQNLQSFALRKTLAIKYDMPGDLESRKRAAPIRTGFEWAMR